MPTVPAAGTERPERPDEGLEAVGIRVLVADDHLLVRTALQRLISAAPDMTVVGTASDGLTVVAMVERLRPDLVVMDLVMPGQSGVHATHEVTALCPAPRVLVLSGHVDRSLVEAANRAGAAGYLSKGISGGQLLDAIRRAHGGHGWFTVGAA
jgi:DNA-binding NarL/FixJ family response regulator